MGSSRTRVSGTSLKVWGAWALGLLTGLAFLGLGLLGLVGGPTLLRVPTPSRAVWFPLLMSLALAGGTLVLAGTLVADRRYRRLRGLLDERDLRREPPHPLLARVYKRAFDDAHTPGGTRWSLVVLYGVLLGLVAGAGTVALGLDPLALLPLP